MSKSLFTFYSIIDSNAKWEVKEKLLLTSTTDWISNVVNKGTQIPNPIL